MKKLYISVLFYILSMNYAFAGTLSVNGPGTGSVNITGATGGGGGTTSPGGSDANVQINHPAGTFYGDSGFQYDPSVSSVTVKGDIGIAGIFRTTSAYNSISGNGAGFQGISAYPYIFLNSNAAYPGGHGGFSIQENGPSFPFVASWETRSSGGNESTAINTGATQVVIQDGSSTGFRFSGTNLEMNFGADFGVGPRFTSDGLFGNFYSTWTFNNLLIGSTETFLNTVSIGTTTHEGQVKIVAPSGIIPLIVQDPAPVGGFGTTDITQWRTTDGTVVSSVTADGSMITQSTSSCHYLMISGLSPGVMHIVATSSGVATALVSLSTEVTGVLPASNLNSNLIVESRGILYDGSGAAIVAGSTRSITIPFNCTISSWTVLADQAGNISVSIKKASFANYPTLTSMSSGGNPPSLSSAQKNAATPASWASTSLSAGDTLSFVLDSASTITWASITLWLVKT